MTNKLYTQQPHYTDSVIPKRNDLLGKVVLLIGNNTAVLHTLIQQLAQRGADIALVCRHLPQEVVLRVQETVESLGHRFLYIESPQYQPNLASHLVDTVISDLGNLDAFIFLAGASTPVSAESL